MPLLPTIADPGFVFEHQDFPTLDLLDNLPFDYRIFNYRLADAQCGTIHHQEHILEVHRRADIERHVIDFDRLSRPCDVLLATRFYNCIFHTTPPASLRHHTRAIDHTSAR
jgi:hypothetical protein